MDHTRKGREPGMKETVTYVTQSKFFTPAFNAAIFDGPIRIYFAQHQESQALKLYFNLQERYGDVRRNARAAFREKGCNIFVMLYPTEETFDHSFGDDAKLGSGAGAEAGPILGTGLVGVASGAGAAVGTEAATGMSPGAAADAGVGTGAGGRADAVVAGVGPIPIIAKDRLGADYVLGVRGPLEDEVFETLCQEMDGIVRTAEG